MVAYNKFQGFVGYLCNGNIDCNADTFNVYLSNTTPSASLDDVKADLAEIGTGNGYTGPVDVTNTGSETTGTYTCIGNDVTITATGTMNAFQYVVMYDDTVSTPVVDPLICWWDYGSALTLNAGESLTIDFGDDDSPTGSTLFTVA